MSPDWFVPAFKPANVQRLFGFALSLAQVGDKHDAAKKMPKRMQRNSGNENPNC
jgi:hypothetical protein